MKSVNDILEDLWIGDVRMKEKMYDAHNEDIQKLSSLLDSLHLEIANKLSEEVFERFNKYEKTHGRYAELISEYAFKQGVSFGVKFIIDALSQE